MPPEVRYRRRWRDYETPLGHRPVKKYIAALPREDAAEVIAAMKDVAIRGLIAARHLRGHIYEVRAEGIDQTFRVLFAPQGRHSQVLLSLEAFSKKTRRTPPAKLDLAEQRLADWLARGKANQ